jgi:hypothetical protein
MVKCYNSYTSPFYGIKIILIFNVLGMGIGDWGLGIGDWAQSPIPNPQSPIFLKKLFFESYLQFIN